LNRAAGFDAARAGGLIGVRQHGDAGLMMLGGVLDVQTLELAGRAAREIVSTPNEESAGSSNLPTKRYDAMSDIAMN
jgi:RecG-like helicase